MELNPAPVTSPVPSINNPPRPVVLLFSGYAVARLTSDKTCPPYVDVAGAVLLATMPFSAPVTALSAVMVMTPAPPESVTSKPSALELVRGLLILMVMSAPDAELTVADGTVESVTLSSAVTVPAGNVSAIGPLIVPRLSMITVSPLSRFDAIAGPELPVMVPSLLT